MKKTISQKIKTDKSDMRQVILNFPEQFRFGFESVKNIKKQINNLYSSDQLTLVGNIIICGIGGSALPGSLIKLISKKFLADIKTQIIIHRDYGLPFCASKKSLIICVSYSGNTEETISAYLEAKRKNFKIISIASGGKLLELSRKYATPIAIVPARIQPRCALGYQFSALVGILEELKFIKNVQKKLLESVKNLNVKGLEKTGEKLAKKIINKIPIIYCSQSNKALAYLWKIKFNENSKIPSFWNYFPELNHNEMVGYTLAKKYFSIIILRDIDDNKRMQKRMELTARILEKKEKNISFIELSEKNIWEKIFNNLILADWTSYHLAAFNKIDPMPVKIVEELKKELK